MLITEGFPICWERGNLCKIQREEGSSKAESGDIQVLHCVACKEVSNSLDSNTSDKSSFKDESKTKVVSDKAENVFQNLLVLHKFLKDKIHP